VVDDDSMHLVVLLSDLYIVIYEPIEGFLVEAISKLICLVLPLMEIADVVAELIK
jgi:hypothetical protein